MTGCRGLYDLHVHAAPCADARCEDAVTILSRAEQAGMAGIAFKSPHVDTASLAAALGSQTSVHVFGGVVLNHGVGGVNPYAVEASLSMRTVAGRRPGRIVWLPTRHSVDHLRQYGPENVPPVRLWDDDGRPLPELIDVFRLIVEHDAVLATGHLGYDEVVKAVEVARGIGVERIICTHVDGGPVSLTLDQQRDLARRGVHLEHSFASALVGPAAKEARLRVRHGAPVEHMVAGIRATGAAMCVLSTDLGAAELPEPVGGLVTYLDQLGALGVTDSEIRQMMGTTPAGLIGDV